MRLAPNAQRVASMYARIDALAPGRWPMLWTAIQNGAAFFSIKAAEWNLKQADESGEAAAFDAALENLEQAWTRAVDSALRRMR